jgi:hypothetical protein
MAHIQQNLKLELRVSPCVITRVSVYRALGYHANYNLQVDSNPRATSCTRPRTDGRNRSVTNGDV